MIDQVMKKYIQIEASRSFEQIAPDLWGGDSAPDDCYFEDAVEPTMWNMQHELVSLGSDKAKQVLAFIKFENADHAEFVKIIEDTIKRYW